MTDTIQIRTAHNVLIDYPIAKPWERVQAYVIDILIKLGYAVLINLTFFESGFNDLGGISMYLSYFFLLPLAVYHLCFEIFNNGQTPGKKAMKIKVVAANGGKSTLGMYVIRWILRLIDFQLFTPTLAFIVTTVTHKGQRIGDIAANTAVINLSQRFSSADTIYEALNDQYIIQYEGVHQLTKKDILLIKEVVNNTSENRFQLLVSLAEKVCKKIGEDKMEGSEQFLKTVLKDYNHIQQMDDSLLD